MSEPLITDLRPGVAILTLNRPQARNALNTDLLSALERVLVDIAADRSIGVVVFRGAGRFFCAGGDLKERALLPLEGDGETLGARSRREGELLAMIDRQPQLSLAAIDGGACGAGLGIVCACDLAIATATSVFSAPEVRVGALPVQIAPLVARCVGWRHVRRLLLSGERIDASEARRVGIVNDVVLDRTALDQALESRLVDLGSCDPAAVAATKAVLERILSWRSKLSGVCGRRLR